MSGLGWIGVDLDGTLAAWDGTWRGPRHIGEPVPAMVDRVRGWIDAGHEVRIVTARVAPVDVAAADLSAAREAIQAWCLTHLGKQLPITATKDFRMLALYDDRCVRVEINTGRLLSEEGL